MAGLDDQKYLSVAFPCEVDVADTNVLVRHKNLVIIERIVRGNVKAATLNARTRLAKWIIELAAKGADELVRSDIDRS